MKYLIYCRATYTSLFLFAIMSIASAETGIAASAEETSPLGAGDQAPNFTVYQVNGTPYHFNANELTDTTLIITFRGGWCPYCNTQLQELRDVIPEIRQKGVDILFLSGDRPEILYSNLKQETRDFIDNLDYTILSDADMDMGKAFGLAFRVPDSTITKYKSRDWDLASSSMERQRALSVPAVYVIRPGGEIAFAYANPDYRVRLPAEEVRIAVEEIVAEEKPAYRLGPPEMDMM